ncbi:unnamed protein product [Cladocopium goreaui]|uniref:Uncharacterized protein n=1 Tax=Cladocopium goreaui TaxID=2562237 RepID=A0A9P1DP72_9DINO|nr:unnamed protein product [Cladocopium goreaui]
MAQPAEPAQPERRKLRQAQRERLRANHVGTYRQTRSSGTSSAALEVDSRRLDPDADADVQALAKLKELRENLEARGELEALTSEEKIALEVQTTGELTQRSNVQVQLKRVEAEAEMVRIDPPESQVLWWDPFWSIWTLWTQLSQSLYMMERALWPDQAAETPLNIALPPDSRPLSDILLDGFDPMAPCIYTAIQALESFRDWFLLSYDVNIHADLHTMLADAMLIFRTAEAILRLKQRCQALQQVPVADPIHRTTSDEPNAAASSSPNTSTAPTRSSVLHGDTGGHLEWY